MTTLPSVCSPANDESMASGLAGLVDARPTPPEAMVFPEVSGDLIRRFDVSGPRYTSYPTADRFHAGYGETEYLAELSARERNPARPPLSAYVHIPFCRSLCYFCACNKIITQDVSRAGRYLDLLSRELALLDSRLGADRACAQLHLGGGSPTFLDPAQLTRLMGMLSSVFDWTPDAEIGIEIDPRTLQDDTLARLAALGFNRTSFGVQDLDPVVQQAINRIQPIEQIERALAQARSHGFRSINVDLIYGLPHQDEARFSRTLDALVTLAPDRIALYNYAHLPERFKAQRLIDAAALPDAATRLRIFLLALRRLTEAGYEYIGMDHFARPDDELSLSRRLGGLHRNFQGYTTRAQCDLVGLGVSAIGQVGRGYVQSVRTIKAYEDSLMAGRLPVDRGYQLDADDLLRRDIIMALMCSMPLDLAEVGARHGVDLPRHLADEWRRLAPFVGEGLLLATADRLQVTLKGRLFVRAIAMTFDRHLAQQSTTRYSSVV